jgi:hypothetical protein
MTKSVWAWSAMTLAALVVAWTAAVSATAPPALRSEHSAPAYSAPPVVVVAPDGKLFHRAGCTYIHGPAQTETGEQALAEGYTPCTRCLPSPHHSGAPVHRAGQPGQAVPR